MKSVRAIEKKKLLTTRCVNDRSSHDKRDHNGGLFHPRAR